jgi:thioredoxin-like negative regulator of GroEL
MTTTDPVQAQNANGQPKQRPRLVLFYSTRSGKSRRVDGYLAQVLQRRRNHDTFAITRIDADEHPDLATRFSVAKLPTLLVIDDNRVRGRLSEPSGCVQITELLQPWLT